jgi:hypothetical protein
MSDTTTTGTRCLRLPAIRDIDWVAARFGHQ